MTQEEFKSKRRMFAVKDRTVLIAPEWYPYSHIEWLGEVLGYDVAQEWVKNHTRGYILDERVVAYRGEDFSHRIDHRDFKAILDVVAKIFNIKEVGFGAIPSSPWEPRDVMNLETYRDTIKVHLK